MLEVIKFKNGRYGLRNKQTKTIVDRDWRTKRGAIRASTKQNRKLAEAVLGLFSHKGKV